MARETFTRPAPKGRSRECGGEKALRDALPTARKKGMFHATQGDYHEPSEINILSSLRVVRVVLSWKFFSHKWHPAAKPVRAAFCLNSRDPLKTQRS